MACMEPTTEVQLRNQNREGYDFYGEEPEEYDTPTDLHVRVTHQRSNNKEEEDDFPDDTDLGGLL